MSSFEIKPYPEMWKALDMDVPRFDKMRLMMGDMYAKAYLSQPNRPDGMAYFDNMIAEIHGGRVKELLAAKTEGRPVIGTFCVYIPEEIVLAAGGICVGLCGGSQGSVPDAEKILPRNICPMVKSAFGFKAARICPYFQAVDFVYGETTCDAKKKTWEILDKLVPTYVMEIPQCKNPRDIALWNEEVKDFKAKVEEVAGKTISETDLAAAIKVMNNKRRALQRLNSLRHHNPTPISGKDGLLIEQIAFYDEPVRFTEKVNDLCDELEVRIKNEVAVPATGATRIMVAGTPMALPNWKIHTLVEGAGAVIVNEESCIGTRYFKDLVDETVTGMDNMLAALTDRYKEIDCSCFTPNNERITQVIKEFRDSGAQGIINYSLQFCHTYNIEEIRIRQACEAESIPYMFIESDYSPEDIGQLQTRVEAFLELIGE
ncbi:MAG: double-cubane-cluster-containing anaerobic reductase [Desulfobulbaceae bacterium]|jgi:benzoyl-CoA reductase/2-hydroxyglutaryl-CoA dehydratase subunit BcrC/BadD/HgdB|nr:double-cubane-cluster-containing anaerobic reductase [Desulfobulbaceae bacterium]